MAKKKELLAQKQHGQPGKEYLMHPRPEYIRKDYKGSGRLKGKVALITGGDSGIGRAVAVHFAREGADVAITYLEEEKDAEYTKGLVEKEGARCLLVRWDLRDGSCDKEVMNAITDELGGLHILVNNAAVQFPESNVEDITMEHLQHTFDVNILAMIRITRAAMPMMERPGRIINTASVTAFRGSEHLIDYASTKGAIVGFTRSLAKNLAKENINVNAVAPGPIWTPLIPASFTAAQVKKFGKDTPMGRPGQPSEVAPLYVLLASADASYITGQTFHVNGGEVVGG